MGNWDLRTCGRRGHVVYAPDEQPLRRRLRVATPAGEAWRCLRCGDFVIGEPGASGPADRAPLVLRGRALRDAFILRLLALERGVRGLLLLAATYAVVYFQDQQASLSDYFEHELTWLRPAAQQLNVDLDHTSIVRLSRRILHLDHSTLTWIAVGLAVYGLLELAEGVGLWLLKRWAEYLTAVATAIFLPYEIYELAEKVTWVRVGALVLNVLALVYLLLAKRLFGLRGGAEAYERERATESLLEIEHAAAIGAPAQRRAAEPTAAHE